jgi:hypothetical protein
MVPAADISGNYSPEGHYFHEIRAIVECQNNAQSAFQFAILYGNGRGLYCETAMHRFSFLVLVMVLVTADWSACRAAGSYQTKPMFTEVSAVKAGTAEPTIKPASPSGVELMGCGRGRVRDPETHGCRGPADIR